MKVFLIVTVLISTLYVLLWLFSSILYFLHRKTFLLKHRLPFLTLFNNVLLLLCVLITTYEQVAYHYGLFFTCIFTLVVLNLGMASVGNYLVVKMAYLNDIYFRQHEEKRSFSNKFFLSTSNRLLVLIAMSSVHVLASLVVYVVVSYSNSDYYSCGGYHSCLLGEEYYLLVGNGVTTLIFSLSIFTKFRGVKEKLKIKRELMLQIASVFLVFAGMLPMIVLAKLYFSADYDQMRGYLFFGPNYFSVLLVAYPNMIATLILPLVLHYKGYRGHGGARRSRYSVEVCDAASMARFLANDDNLQEIMKVARDYFCVELVEFWVSVEDYRECMMQEKAEEKKHIIERDYIRKNAHSELNISQKVKEGLAKNIRKKDKGRKVFDGAVKEVLGLIMNNLYSTYLENK